jgi:hypothetical protein
MVRLRVQIREAMKMIRFQARALKTAVAGLRPAIPKMTQMMFPGSKYSQAANLTGNASHRRAGMLKNAVSAYIISFVIS